MAPNVALVFGSFFMGDSERDIKTIKENFPGIEGLEVADPSTGDDFNFDMLKDCKFLIVCTSSTYGFPPKNFGNFAHHLLTAATKHPGCLSHLQHAVYGNGDETYFNTYMNMPRYMDMLLEKVVRAVSLLVERPVSRMHLWTPKNAAAWSGPRPCGRLQLRQRRKVRKLRPLHGMLCGQSTSPNITLRSRSGI